VELVLRAQKLLHAVVHAHGEILFGGGDKTLRTQGASQGRAVNAFRTWINKNARRSHQTNTHRTIKDTQQLEAYPTSINLLLSWSVMPSFNLCLKLETNRSPPATQTILKLKKKKKQT
jgi:hypothetical protein